MLKGFLVLQRAALFSTNKHSLFACSTRYLASKMVKAKKFILVQHFEGEPKQSDLKLVEEDLPSIKDGEFLCQAEFISVDPYMRAYSTRLTPGSDMIGGQVAKIVESKHKKYPVGSYVVGYYGWRTHTIVNPDDVSGNAMNRATTLLPDLGGVPSSTGIGVLGMPGATAYFGFLKICEPKEGETVVVSGAAGAVGSLVGQIAKIKGCRVIGYAGSDDKVQWLIKELGFDHAYNYKKVDLRKSLKEAAPNGVDCYFDNVGGIFSSTVIQHMNEFGRISACGAISTYNDDPKNPTLVPAVEGTVIFKQLKMEGFIVTRWEKQFHEAIMQMLAWIKEGKLKYRETIYDGFENMPQSFMKMMKGDNTGKAVVKV